MSYLVDTNVLFELRKRHRCDPNVAAWYQSARVEELFLSVLVIGELRRGAERLRARDPRQYAALDKWLILAVDRFADRIIQIDRLVAEEWGRIDAHEPVPATDGLLAATARVKGLTLVTRNIRHMERTGAKLLNPFEPMP